MLAFERIKGVPRYLGFYFLPEYSDVSVGTRRGNERRLLHGLHCSTKKVRKRGREDSIIHKICFVCDGKEEEKSAFNEWSRSGTPSCVALIR